MKKVRAKKYLGQHFLRNNIIAQNITNELDTNLNKNILEIGPGMGVLTKFLLNQKLNLKLVEIDAESVQYLKTKFPEVKNDIYEEDFLKIKLPELYKNSVSIIGNFPYNISSQILFKVFENKDQVVQVIGMFQKEVAERLCAKEGRKKGILTILLQTFYDVEYCFNVDPDVFFPKPKVNSAVIKLTRNNRKKINCDEKLFIQIIKSSYNQRRKTLRNALKAFSLEEDKKIKGILNLRAEQLAINDFIILTNHVNRERTTK